MIRCLVLFSCAVASLPTLRSAAVTEPPYRLVVEVDGQTVHLDDGQRGEVTIGDRKVVVRAAVLPTRVLSAKGVRFEFLRAMDFEVEESDHLSSWTLDGGDCTVMLTRWEAIEAPRAREHLTSTVAAASGHAEEVQDIEWQLGKEKVRGAAVRWRLAALHMQMTVLRLEVRGVGFLLTLQDSLDDDGALSAESQQMHRVLRESFAIEER